METIARRQPKAVPCHPAQLEEVHAAIGCLQRLVQAFVGRREQLAREVGLTDSQWGLLEEISSEHFMPSLFAVQQASTRGAVSKIIRQLIDKGLITVLVSKDDGRQRKYELTQKGKRVMAQLREKRERAIHDIWLKLDRAEVLAFAAVGDEIATRIEQYLKKPQLA